MTHADTLLAGAEMRGPCRAFASSSSSMPSHAEASQMRAADLRRVLADAGGEDQPVDAAQHGGQRADLLGRPVDEVVDGEARLRLGCCPSRSRMSLLMPEMPSRPDFL